MTKKISAIEIQRFRGIPKSLKLDFWNKSADNPCSFIIFGDNGTGKSSVIDALEFGLQARIERTQSLKSELKPSPISLKDFDTAKIKITFQDTTTLDRQIQIKKEEDVYRLKLVNSQAHQDFSIAPIVLRRIDILKFIQTPSHQKQVLFFGYIKSLIQENSIEFNTTEPTELKIEKMELKIERRELVEKLAKKIGITSDEISVSPKEFDLLISDKIYNGINKKQRDLMSRKGIKFHVNHQALDIANEIKNVSEKIQSINRKEPKKINDSEGIQEKTQDKLSKIFSDAGSYLTESFKAISSSNFFDRIEMRIGDVTKVSFDIIVHLKNGKEIQPNNIFSEANLDLLALLVFLSIIKEAADNGQEKVLILDDVLQSVDSSIRLMFVDFLLKSFKDWQLIFSIHDRLFLNQLKTIFRRHNHEFSEVEILKWDFENGPFIIKKDTEKNNSLAIAISTSDINLISSQAGVLLETICNHLSYSLPISIVRKKEDKYTLGDLFPGVFKKLKRTELGETLETIEKLSFLRNLFGAHYNEWALSLSNTEIFQYANSIKTLYEYTFCETCLTWITNTSNNSWKCACGKCNLTSKS